MITSNFCSYLPLLFHIASRRVPRQFQLHVTYINKELNILTFSKAKYIHVQFPKICLPVVSPPAPCSVCLQFESGDQLSCHVFCPFPANPGSYWTVGYFNLRQDSLHILFNLLLAHHAMIGRFII
jgi:hypothetical protein